LKLVDYLERAGAERERESKSKRRKTKGKIFFEKLIIDKLMVFVVILLFGR
jgi:hypothetical protein